jgi:enamine deaminase RidA (YjgF/YER057c/UK114 family)
MTTTASRANSHTAVNPWTWQDPLGFAQAVAVDGPRRLLVCAGQAAVDGDGVVVFPGDMARQLDAALDNLETVLAAGGFEMGDVVQVRLYVTDMSGYFAAQEAFIRRFAARGIPVAATLVGVTGLALPDLLVELEALAVR